MLETKQDQSAAASAAPRVIDHFVTGKKAWVRADIRRDDWYFRLTPACLAELNAITTELRQHPGSIEQIDPARFPLPACRDFMRRVQTALDDGVGFALVDRLPMDELSDDEAKALYWILSSLLARPVQQKLTGTLLYDVHDTGKKATPGSGVRPDQTNADQFFHNDNSYNTTQPEYVGLLCVRPAKTGGVSQVLSFYTLHNELLRAHPDVIPRLYQPFWFDRQKEYHDSEPAVIRAPIFAYDGRLRVRLGTYQAKGGYTLMNEIMDEAGVTAIDTVRSLFSNEALAFDFVMERGQMQFVNNLEICHRRTAFEDFDEPRKKRLLVRVWLRNAGEPRYQG
jgi:hypothetical protein